MNCPDCQSTMTNTKAGWACLNCGNMIGSNAATQTAAAETPIEPQPAPPQPVPPPVQAPEAQTPAPVLEAVPLDPPPAPEIPEKAPEPIEVAQQPSPEAPQSPDLSNQPLPEDTFQPPAPITVQTAPFIQQSSSPPIQPHTPPILSANTLQARARSSRKPIVRLVLFIFLAALIIGGGVSAYLVLKTNTPPVTPIAPELPAPDPTPVPVVVTGVDCGLIIVTDLSKDAFEGCFNQHYVNCEQATVVFNVQAEGAKDTKIRYATQSKQADKCLVTWSYLVLPDNPTWENKDITCPYSIGPSFQIELEKQVGFEGCSGPLLELINGDQNSNSSPTEQPGVNLTPDQ